MAFCDESGHFSRRSRHTAPALDDRTAQRIRSEKDRRVVYVALTPHYEDVREEIESSVLRKFPDLIGRMSPEEIEQIQTGLAVLEKALKRPG